MLLVFVQKLNPRIPYVFKHICTRILGIEVNFTSVIEEFIAHTGPKISYGKQPMGNELFIQSHGLLTQQGIESVDFTVKEWEETKCFFSTSDKSALPFDIFAASFYLLSRYEEYLPHVKDAFDRYPASESIGVKENFLTQPVIDIWAYKFKRELVNTFSKLSFGPKNYTIHTLVETRQPYAYKQKGFFRSLIGYLSDLFRLRLPLILKRTKVIVGMAKDPNDIFEWLINVAKKNSAKLTVFFLLGEAINFEESINTRRQKFKMLIKFINDYKQVGLIFSRKALEEPELQKEEKERIEMITNRALEGAMNAQYLVDLPNVYRNLVELEVQRDFTMVYQDAIGFRAGTCTPFLFYDLDFEIKTPLIVHPIATCTSAFLGKKEDEIQHSVDSLIASVKSVNGTFSMLFLNTDFSLRLKNRIWRTIFSEKLQDNTNER